MISTDARNLTWEQVRATLSGRRLAVYEAWQKFGPGTTRELAERSGFDILTLRPRTTELLQLGFLCCTENREGEGFYVARSEAQALATWQARQAQATPEAAQLPLKLNA